MTSKTLSAIPAMLASLLLSACVGGAGDAAKPDAKAFEWALSEDIRFNTVVAECSPLSPELAKTAQQLRQQWQKNYWPALNAADYQYNLKQAARTYLYNGEKVSLPAVKLMTQQKSAALDSMYRAKRLPEKQREYCETRLSSYERHEDGLGNPAYKNRLLYLNELAHGHGAPALTPRALPSLAGTLGPSTSGASLYSVEQLSHSTGCQKPEIFTVHNQGPAELFAVYCTPPQDMFISCEWGSCNRLAN